MAFKIPQPIVLLPGGQGFPNLRSLAFETPKEGRRYIPVEIDWTGTPTTYEVNVAGLTTQTFSQMVMLDIDNTQSGADVTFYFPDSTDTLVVPADSAGLFPIFTNALLMYVSAPLALASDITRFRILNYRQEPIANPPPEFSDVATALNLTAPGTTAILPATQSGTLVGYTVNFTGNANAGGFSGWTGALIDHASGKTIEQGSIIVPTASAESQIIMNTTGIALRFAGGLDFTITNFDAAWTSQQANVAVRYRTP